MKHHRLISRQKSAPQAIMAQSPGRLLIIALLSPALIVVNPLIGLLQELAKPEESLE